MIGVSARPIACTDVLCFGPADLPDAELPTGVSITRIVMVWSLGSAITATSSVCRP